MRVKKVMSVLVVLMMFFCMINQGTVKADTSGDYTYSVNQDGTITITKYNGLGGDVEIPSQIDGKNVIGIGYEAFCGCNNIVSVVIPNGVTTIGSDAFSSCGSLKNITMPDSIITIEDYTFRYCSSLTNIKLSNNLTTIKMWAFFNCTSLKSINIPKSVTSIQQGAFANCSTLKAAYFCGDAPSVFDANAFKFLTMLEGVRWRTNPDFKIYCKKNSLGFTFPTWNGYNTELYEVPNRFIVNVMDSDTWEPISGVTVKVGDQTAVTNDKGVATFSGLASGPTDIHISKEGYYEDYYEQYNIPSDNGCYFSFLDEDDE